MHRVMILGAGNIGSLLSVLLASEQDYYVVVGDRNLDHPDFQKVGRDSPVGAKIITEQCDVMDSSNMAGLFKKHNIDTLISCLPFQLTKHVATLAKENKLNYFDLTEDVESTAYVKELAKDANTAFVPQCGLAPGFVTIAAKYLMDKFDEVRDVHLRVGALPQNSNNRLHYACTWSPEGLVNEYLHPATVIRNGKLEQRESLAEVEIIQLEGARYEAFNTSGGLGSLGEMSVGLVNNMDYKTIRYPGHCDAVRAILLCSQASQEQLVDIFKSEIPKTQQDKVIVYVSVSGYRQGELIEESLVKTIYPKVISHILWSAIQVSTAAGLAAVVDLVLAPNQKTMGLVLQENINYNSFMTHRFGRYFLEEPRFVPYNV